MVQRFGSVHALSFRLLAGHAFLVLGTSALAQAPATPQLPPPVSTGDIVQPLLPAQLQDFDAYMAHTLKTFEVPGIAVAIVKNGKVVMERGFGVKELGKPDPVDVFVFFISAAKHRNPAAAMALQSRVDSAS